MPDTAPVAPTGTPDNPLTVKPETNLLTLANTMGPWALVALVIGGALVDKIPTKTSPPDTACHCAVPVEKPTEKPAQPPSQPALPVDDLKKVLDKIDTLQTTVDALKKK